MIAFCFAIAWVGPAIIFLLVGPTFKLVRLLESDVQYARFVLDGTLAELSFQKATTLKVEAVNRQEVSKILLDQAEAAREQATVLEEEAAKDGADAAIKEDIATSAEADGLAQERAAAVCAAEAITAQEAADAALVIAAEDATEATEVGASELLIWWIPGLDELGEALAAILYESAVVETAEALCAEEESLVFGAQAAEDLLEAEAFAATATKADRKAAEDIVRMADENVNAERLIALAEEKERESILQSDLAAECKVNSELSYESGTRYVILGDIALASAVDFRASAYVSYFLNLMVVTWTLMELMIASTFEYCFYFCSKGPNNVLVAIDALSYLEAALGGGAVYMLLLYFSRGYLADTIIASGGLSLFFLNWHKVVGQFVAWLAVAACIGMFLRFLAGDSHRAWRYLLDRSSLLANYYFQLPVYPNVAALFTSDWHEFHGLLHLLSPRRVIDNWKVYFILVLSLCCVDLWITYIPALQSVRWVIKHLPSGSNWTSLLTLTEETPKLLLIGKVLAVFLVIRYTVYSSPYIFQVLVYICQQLSLCFYRGLCWLRGGYEQLYDEPQHQHELAKVDHLPAVVDDEDRHQPQPENNQRQSSFPWIAMFVHGIIAILSVWMVLRPVISALDVIVKSNELVLTQRHQVATLLHKELINVFYNCIVVAFLLGVMQMVIAMAVMRSVARQTENENNSLHIAHVISAGLVWLFEACIRSFFILFAVSLSILVFYRCLGDVARLLSPCVGLLPCRLAYSVTLFIVYDMAYYFPAQVMPKLAASLRRVMSFDQEEEEGGEEENVNLV